MLRFVRLHLSSVRKPVWPTRDSGGGCSARSLSHRFEFWFLYPPWQHVYVRVLYLTPPQRLLLDSLIVSHMAGSKNLKRLKVESGIIAAS